MRTRFDGLETRKRVLDAACEVFAERGHRANIAALNYHPDSNGVARLEAIHLETLVDHCVRFTMAGLNFSLRSVWDRLAQAEAAARKTGASLWPSVTGTVNARRNRSEVDGRVPDEIVNDTDLSQGAVASYEVDLRGRVRSARDAAALDASVLPQVARDFPGLTQGYEGRQADMADSMKSLYGGLFLALLAIPFRSYTQPLIVMTSIAFGIVGAVLGHMAMGYHLSVMSVMGIIALSGVVVNDSLVLIEYANQLRDEGQSLIEAVCSAGIRRFRPILLTTLTTFGGLAPMIFETSRQARFMIPMAISLGYGILFGTVIALLIVPCLYLVVEDVKGWLGVGREEEEATAAVAPRVSPGA